LNPAILTWGGFSLNLDDRPHVMGVVNITPDSFSDGGDFLDPGLAVEHGLRLAAEGADILDVGGESTRPGAEAVDAVRETARVVQVVRELVRQTGLPVSIDTYKSAVARAALEAGASMINDVSAGRFDPEILDLAARAGVPIILMHMKGRPRNMQKNPVYDDLLGEISSFLAEAAGRAEEAGVDPDLVLVDPGLGFGKTFDHNVTLINRLAELARLGRPLVVGPSRKAFLGHILGGAAPKDREAATAAAATICAYNGAHVLRVHSVETVREALAVVRAVKKEQT
jgi:dihydropteroate synthase